jgi:hypothetical protein
VSIKFYVISLRSEKSLGCVRHSKAKIKLSALCFNVISVTVQNREGLSDSTPTFTHNVVMFFLLNT